MNAHQYSSSPKVGFGSNFGDREVSDCVASGTTTKRACYVCGSYNHLQNFHAKVANEAFTFSTTPKRFIVVNTNSPAAASSVKSVSMAGTESGPVTNMIGSLSIRHQCLALILRAQLISILSKLLYVMSRFLNVM